MPTEEEKTKILEAEMANPDIPLGTAEQFLLTLAGIVELEARLKLWLFKLDYDTMERVCESCFLLKNGMKYLCYHLNHVFSFRRLNCIIVL